MNRDLFWRILALRGIPPKFVNLLCGLYFGLETAVPCGGSIFDYFSVNTVVRQGDVLAPTLFNTCMDHVLVRMTENPGCGMWFGTVRITDLNFADNAVILAETTFVAGALLSSSICYVEKQSRLDCEFLRSGARSRKSVASSVRPFSQLLQAIRMWKSRRRFLA